MRGGLRTRAAACLAATLLAAGLTACTSDAGHDSGGQGSDAGSPESSAASGSAPSDGASTATSASPGSPTPSSASDAGGEAVAAVTDLATTRLAALAHRDRAAWLSTVTDPQDAFGQQQGAVFDRMTQLPLGALAMRGISVGPADPGTDPAAAAAAAPGGTAAPPASAPAGTSSMPAGGVVARLTTGYQLVGYDRGERTFDVSYAVAKGPSGWRLTALAPGDSAAQPWDLPGMTVVSSPTALVVGDVSPDLLHTYLSMADAGLARVGGVLGASLSSVLVAPRTTDELVRQLGRASSGGLNQVAAVTDGPLGTGAPAAADRVYLNPATFATLTPTGRQVVITHELTHVTIRGTTTRPVPTWLSEGFADYVGFSGSGLGVGTVAADLLTLVRRGQGPQGLPTAADFDPTTGTISPVYNQAWLAVTRIAQQHGQAAAVAFYRFVAGGPTPDAAVRGSADDLTRSAFSTVLGTTQEAFVADWVAYLRRLAG